MRPFGILFVALCLSLSLPATASTITGADGILDVATDYTLPFRSDGSYDFSSVNIGSGSTLRFDTGLTNVTLLSIGDIVIYGTVDASGLGTLTLGTNGQILIYGSLIVPQNLNLLGGATLLTQGTTTSTNSTLGSGGNLSLSSGGSLSLGGGSNVGGTTTDTGGGTFTLSGGGSLTVSDNTGTLATTITQVSAVPEPATALLMLPFLPILLASARGKTAR